MYTSNRANSKILPDANLSSQPQTKIWYLTLSYVVMKSTTLRIALWRKWRRVHPVLPQHNHRAMVLRARDAIVE